MKERLFNMYKLWTKEVGSKCKDLCIDGYSNPCYLGVPDDWENASNRIMIVGEEGYGDWGFGKKSGWNDVAAASGSLEEEELFTGVPIAVFGEKTINAAGIERLMAYNTWAVGYHLQKDRNKVFWRRFGNIAGLEDCAVIWNNIDKMYSRERRGKLKYALRDDERKLLHGVPTKVLKEEIDILKPNVVVFFGWHVISLREELPDIAAEYEKSKEEALASDIVKMCDESKTRIATKGYLCETERDGVTYILSYHPTWGNFQKGYEGAVFEMVKSALKKQ